MIDNFSNLSMPKELEDWGDHCAKKYINGDVLMQIFTKDVLSVEATDKKNGILVKEFNVEDLVVNKEIDKKRKAEPQDLSRDQNKKIKGFSIIEEHDQVKKILDAACIEKQTFFRLKELSEYAFKKLEEAGKNPNSANSLNAHFKSCEICEEDIQNLKLIVTICETVRETLNQSVSQKKQYFSVKTLANQVLITLTENKVPYSFKESTLATHLGSCGLHRKDSEGCRNLVDKIVIKKTSFFHF